ncbi:MAG: hypothetical protein WC522_09170 [Candidatus Omnitrophota bacterium]
MYNFVKFSEGKIGVMIGDVSGKGIPASLFMAIVSCGDTLAAIETDVRKFEPASGQHDDITVIVVKIA